MIDELQYIGETLKKAQAHGIENEVMMEAMLYMQNNEDCSIEDALTHSLQEWDLL